MQQIQGKIFRSEKEGVAKLMRIHLSVGFTRSIRCYYALSTAKNRLIELGGFSRGSLTIIIWWI